MYVDLVNVTYHAHLKVKITRSELLAAVILKILDAGGGPAYFYAGGEPAYFYFTDFQAMLIGSAMSIVPSPEAEKLLKEAEFLPRNKKESYKVDFRGCEESTPDGFAETCLRREKSDGLIFLDIYEKNQCIFTVSLVPSQAAEMATVMLTLVPEHTY